MVRQIHPSYKHNNNAPSNNAAFIRACGFVALLGWSAFISSSNVSQWLQLAAEPQAHVERVVVRSSHQQDDGGQQNPQEPDKLPDWRLAVDCSAFDFHCLAIKQSQHLYEDYPFPYTRSYDHQDKFDWEILEEIPRDWKSHLEYQSLEEPPPSSVEYVYPPEATKKEKEQCLNSALNDSWKDQLDSLLAHRIQPEKDTNMIAWTISDINYAFDIIHDFFEMNDKVIGYPSAMFLVAIDYPTLELACQYDYPVLAWPSSVPQVNSTEDLKASVANTKFEVSYALVERNVSFLFWESDIWFLKSPKPIIQQFDGDVLFSSHQNCPKCTNIGVYSVVANKKTKEYFQTCIELSKISYNTHDQKLMASVIGMGVDRKGFSYGKHWDPVPDYIPYLRYPVSHGFFSPHEIVADERPYSNQMAVAIHPLRSQPLKSPHGKKILAKESGAWYGFEGPDGKAGYYKRKEKHRRYLWMDGHILNGHSNVMNWEYVGNESGLFHDIASLQWTIATLIALARRTHRIFILPRFLGERGIHFIWTLLDMQSVEELGIDVRETNFPNNPKAWYSETTPFKSAARTALGDFMKDQTMFVQYPDTTIRAWKFVREFNTTKTMDQGKAIDAWWALHTAIPEIDESELLLVNPHFIHMHYHRPLHKRMRTHKGQRPNNADEEEGMVAEYEIASVFYRLRWCTKDIKQDQVVGVFKADDDCYGLGVGL